MHYFSPVEGLGNTYKMSNQRCVSSILSVHQKTIRACARECDVSKDCGMFEYNLGNVDPYNARCQLQTTCTSVISRRGKANADDIYVTYLKVPAISGQLSSTDLIT